MKGRFFVISGPSGAGKSTVISALRAGMPELEFSVSATTRPIRPGEVDGVSYYFRTREQFDAMIAANELLEHAEYVGNCYGTPRAPILEKTEKGIDVITDVDVVGALQIKAVWPDTPLIFIVPPCFAELERRLRGRGDTPEDKIASRLEKARWEYAQAEKYDYIVLNDSVENAVRELESILLSEHCRVLCRSHLLKEEL